MSMIDDVADFISKGVNFADRRTQIVRCQQDLMNLGRQKMQLFANLGQRLLADEQGNQDFARKYIAELAAISNVEQQENEIRAQLAALQHMPMVPRQFLRCVRCGARVLADARFCSQCGENMNNTRIRYRYCSRCNVYYGADAMYCVRCGARIGVAASSMPQSDMSRVDDAVPDPQQPMSDCEGETYAATQPAAPESASGVCPRCGTPAEPDATFCGECGMSLA